MSWTANRAAVVWKGRAANEPAPDRAAWLIGRTKRKGVAIL